MTQSRVVGPVSNPGDLASARACFLDAWRKLRTRVIEAPSVHWLFLVLVALVASFAADIGFTKWSQVRLDRAAESVTESAIPRFIPLARARRHVRAIERLAERATPQTLEGDRVAVLAASDELDRALASFAAPVHPGERDLDEQIRAARARITAALGTAIDAPASRQRAVALIDLAQASDAFDETTQLMFELNASRVTDEVNSIAAFRRSSARISYLLDSATFGLALAGLAVTVAAARQYLTLSDERKALAETRAAELEIFAGRVAHDLRTPLSAIKLRASAAARSPTPELCASTLTRITVQVNRMNEMIKTLLEFARAGARPPLGNRCNVANVLGEVCSELQPLALDAGVDLIVGPADDAQVACAPAALAVVFQNVVRNALQCFRDKREPRRVQVRATARDRNVRCEIEDTGPGLPPGSEARVFDPFVRMTPSADGGTGLGLATVQRLIVAHGGAVGVHSAPRERLSLLVRAATSVVPC